MCITTVVSIGTSITNASINVTAYFSSAFSSIITRMIAAIADTVNTCGNIKSPPYTPYTQST